MLLSAAIRRAREIKTMGIYFNERRITCTVKFAFTSSPQFLSCIHRESLICVIKFDAIHVRVRILTTAKASIVYMLCYKSQSDILGVVRPYISHTPAFYAPHYY